MSLIKRIWTWLTGYESDKPAVCGCPHCNCQKTIIDEVSDAPTVAAPRVVDFYQNDPGYATSFYEEKLAKKTASKVALKTQKKTAAITASKKKPKTPTKKPTPKK